MEAGQHIVSVSLGTVAKPGGVVVIDPRTDFDLPEDEDRKRDWENFYKVTWLERFDPGHPIPAVATRISALMSDERLAKRCHLLLDITATGAAAKRVFERRSLYPDVIELTNGGSEERSGGVRRAPLRDVIGAAQVVLQTRRLEASSKLEHASTLVGDLLGFDPESTTRSLDLRGGRNSDLVFALAVGLWWAENLTWNDDPPERHRPLHCKDAWMAG